MGAAASTVAMGELGKLLDALKVAATRTDFKKGTNPPGVNVGAIGAAVVTRLRGLSEAELALLSDTNEFHRKNGLEVPDHPGIAAV